jgi:hypothetical protein
MGCPESLDGSNEEGGNTGGKRIIEEDPEPQDVEEDAGNSITPPVLEDGGVVAPPEECTPQTPNWGTPCAANPGDPLCGTFGCDFMTGELVCNDPGPNLCGGCDELNSEAGSLNDICGTYECGSIKCNEDATATVCIGDHPRNLCGGCDLGDFDTVTNDEGEVIEVTGPVPGDACSECGSGTQMCSRDTEDLICWQGRSANNSCGTCERCVTHHAYMDQRLEGSYIRSGTTVLVESIGLNQRVLVFDPLVEGPGANGLVMSRVYLSRTADFSISEYTYRTLSPAFAQSYSEQLADPHRQFTVYSSIDLEQYKYVVIYDQFFDTIISIGELFPGAP